MSGKEALLQGARQAREWVQNRWADFRAESPYFQAKVGLVAGYALIVLLTVLLAPPRGKSWDAVAEKIPFGLAFKTALLLTNHRAGDLDHVTVVVSGTGIEFDGKRDPGTWHTKPMSLPEGKETRVLTEQLFDDHGANPPYSLDIDRVQLLDEDKHVVVKLKPKQRTAGGS